MDNIILNDALNREHEARRQLSLIAKRNNALIAERDRAEQAMREFQRKYNDLYSLCVSRGYDI